MHLWLGAWTFSLGVLLWSFHLTLLLTFQADTCSGQQLAATSPKQQSAHAKPNALDSRQPEVAKKAADEPASGTSTSNNLRQQQQQQEWAEGGKRKPKRLGECEYERGPWEECQSNGAQRRRLRLKDGSGAESKPSRQSADLACEPIKTIERECKLVGCKYARGEWSSSCADGKRSRVDTLLGSLGPASKDPAAAASSRCPARRIVTKDCRRACHYIKSAWSDCIDGFKTRNLTLDSNPPTRATNGSHSGKGDDDFSSKLWPSSCLKERLVRRPCRSQDSKLASAAPAARQLPSGPKMKSSAQKRRLQKQQKLQHQQQLHKASEINRNTGGGSGSGSSSGPSARSNGVKRRS